MLVELSELPGERNTVKQEVRDARCTQARKAMHGMDGQYQDVNRTLRGKVNQNDRGRR